MGSPQQIAAGTIAVSAPGFAGLAAESLVRTRPQLVQRFGEAAFRLWKDSFAQRLQELAAALRVGSKDRFVRQVAWEKVAFVSRGHDLEDLRAGFRCLRDVLQKELAAPLGSAATDYVSRALEELDSEELTQREEFLHGNPHRSRAAAYLDHLLKGHRREARDSVVEAVKAGDLTVEQAYLELVLPVQEEVGRMWHHHELNIGEEHFVTGTTKAVMCQLLMLADIREPCEKTVIAAAVQGNAHDVGIQAVADFFEMDGWDAILLGSDVPSHDLAIAAQCFAADLIAISVTLDVQRDWVDQSIRELRKVSEAPVLVGGAAFGDDEALWKSVGADAFAASIPEAVRRGRQLVGLR